VVVLSGPVCSTIATLPFLPTALVELMHWGERMGNRRAPASVR